ncbi:MAG: alpha/beta fold hydrolase [Gemmatimonadales bacterium]
MNPPGRLVPLAGGDIHLLSCGAGSPTVVLDAGLGSSLLDWSLVQDEVARFTRVCSFDRPGYGWSEPRRGGRTSHVMVQELQELLQTAEIDGPYVMVGHSFGGLNVRLFSARNPEKVRGLVLVDASHEEGLQRLPRTYWRFVRLSLRVARWIAPIGGLRLADALGFVPTTRLFEHFPEETAAFARQLCFRSRTMRTALRELAALPVSQRQVTEVGHLGDLPVVVLTSNLFTDSDRELAPGVSLEEMRSAWHVLQSELLRLSSRSRRVLVEDSGHYMAIERPQPVIRAIRETVELARSEAVGAT